jgi:hypothetical protein
MSRPSKKSSAIDEKNAWRSERCFQDYVVGGNGAVCFGAKVSKNHTISTFILGKFIFNIICFKRFEKPDVLKNRKLGLKF